MFPEHLGEVVFRAAYAAQGEAAPVQLVSSKDETHAWVYPKDYKLRTYPPHDDPMALCPHDEHHVELRQLRDGKHPASLPLRDAVCAGKYRSVHKLLRDNPLLDPHGEHAFPLVFHSIGAIDDMSRWRKTIDALVAHGAPLTQVIKHSNCEGWTVAHEAVQKRRYDKLDELQQRGVALTGFPSMDLFDVAIRSLCFDAIGALLARGFSKQDFQKKIPNLVGRHDRYDRNTYQSIAAGGTTLPLPHMALLRHDTQPEHLALVMEALTPQNRIHGPPWHAVRDHHGRTALEMAEHLGGPVATRAHDLRARMEHESLQANTQAPRRASTAGRRL